MDDLPKIPAPSSGPMTPTGGSPIAGSMAKESAPPVVSGEAPIITEIGKEEELPPEVKKAGVTIRSDTVILPKPVAHMGVTPVGPASPPPVTPSVTVPLTDDQIATGLHKSILSSWRWLAEWCARRLKEAHIAVRKVHGVFVRVNE